MLSRATTEQDFAVPRKSDTAVASRAIETKADMSRSQPLPAIQSKHSSARKLASSQPLPIRDAPTSSSLGRTSYQDMFRKPGFDAKVCKSAICTR